MIKSLLHFNKPSNFLYDEVGNTWQSFGNCSVTTQGKFHNALSLNNGYIQNNTINLDFTSDWTLDFWIYIDYYAYISTGTPIFSVRSSSSTPRGGIILQYHTLYIAKKSTNTWDAFNLTLPQSKWLHLALVNYGQNLLFFVNGAKVVDVLNTDVNLASNPEIQLGKDNTVANSLIGFVDEFRVTDKAEWTSNFTPPVTEYNSKALYIGADNSVMGMV